LDHLFRNWDFITEAINDGRTVEMIVGVIVVDGSRFPGLIHGLGSMAMN
jgi:hypothetical protein